MEYLKPRKREGLKKRVTNAGINKGLFIFMTTNEQTLEAAYAARLAILTGQVQSYTVEGTTFTKLSLSELEKMIDKLERKVAIEQNEGSNVFLGQVDLNDYRG